MTLAIWLTGQRNCQADEPIKLAMATPLTTSSTNAVKVLAKVSTTTTNSFSASFTQRPLIQPAATALHLKEADYSTLPAVALTKKQPDSGGFFSGQPGNGNFGFANIEAGYGQAYECDSAVLRGRNGTRSEETRYIFFKKVVKF